MRFASSLIIALVSVLATPAMAASGVCKIDWKTTKTCMVDSDCIAVKSACQWMWEITNVTSQAAVEACIASKKVGYNCTAMPESIKQPNTGCIEGKCEFLQEADHCMERGETSGKCIYICAKWDDKGRCKQEVVN